MYVIRHLNEFAGIDGIGTRSRCTDLIGEYDPMRMHPLSMSTINPEVKHDTGSRRGPVDRSVPR